MLNRFLVFTIAVFFLANQALAEQFPCEQSFANLPYIIGPKNKSQAPIYDFLRAHGLLVSQHSVGGGEQLCAIACAANILQAATVAAHQHAIANIQDIFKHLAIERIAHPEGGTTIANSFLAVEKVINRFGGYGFKVSGFQVGKIDSASSDLKVVQEFSNRDLQLEEGKVKVLFAVIYDPAGKRVSSHALNIESFDGKILKLVDPEDPSVELLAEQRDHMLINNVAVPRFFYAGEHENGYSFAPIGVVTVEVPKGETPSIFRRLIRSLIR